MSDLKTITCTAQGVDLESRQPTPYSLGGMMEVWQDVVAQCTASESDDARAGVLRPATLSDQTPDEVKLDMAALMRMLYEVDGAAARMNGCLWKTADGDAIPDGVAAHVPVAKTARVIHHFIVAHAMLMGALTDTPAST